MQIARISYLDFLNKRPVLSDLFILDFFNLFFCIFYVFFNFYLFTFYLFI